MIELDDIPVYKPRPFRFSLKLAGLCFGCSFVVHAAIVLSMLLTPVPNASAWSSSKQSTQASDRHVVQVTMLLSPTSFEPQPAEAPAESVGSEPTEKVPPSPVAVPELPPTPTSAPEPSTLPSTAKPPTPVEPIATERDIRLEPQPIALDVPRTALNDAPLPQFVEPSASDQPVSEQAEPVALQDALARTDLPEVPVSQVADELPSMPESAPLPPEQVAEQRVEPREQLAVESAEQTAEASEADAEEVETPIESDASDTPAVVYDQDSVDQRITFDKRVRPKLTMASKRMGETGSVLILIEVDADGDLIRHEVLDDAGFPRLLAAALKAMKGSTFEPAIRGEQAVRSTRVIEYRF